MKITMRAAGLLLALPLSTFMVACGDDGDSDRAALEREALERELELALQPDTFSEAELNDLPADEPVAEQSGTGSGGVAPRETPTSRRSPSQPRSTERPVEREPARQPSPSPAPAPSGPRTETITAPAGQTLALRLGRELSTRTSKVGDAVTATLSEPIVAADGTTLIPSGATVTGRVTASSKSGNAGEQAQLRVDFTSISYGGRSYSIDATTLDAEARLASRSTTGEKAAKVGGGAAIGAVLGQVVGRNTKSTVAGAAIGAAAGTAVAIGTDDVDAIIPAGSRITIRLDSPVRVERRA